MVRNDSGIRTESSCRGSRSGMANHQILVCSQRDSGLHGRPSALDSLTIAFASI